VEKEVCVVTAAFAVANHDRIGKLLRLAVIADQPGEIVAAVAALKRALTTSGVDPHWLADAFERGAPPVALQPRQDCDAVHDDDWRSTAWWCWHHRDRRAPRDRQFIDELTRWRGPLSTKQQKWLRDVCDKLAEAA
jgi:hypothetical protein